MVLLPPKDDEIVVAVAVAVAAVVDSTAIALHRLLGGGCGGGVSVRRVLGR